MKWTSGKIDDCIIRPLGRFEDSRGWLTELFRHDDLSSANYPVMAYLSMTLPGVERGPHEHKDQADLFVFFDGSFCLYLWDMRENSATLGLRHKAVYGRDNPASVVVPPGVVHAYRNCGDTPALSINCPNRLYSGWNRQEVVDEIRHEDRDDGLFLLD